MMNYHANKGKSSLYRVAGLSLQLCTYRVKGKDLSYSDNCLNDKIQRVGISGDFFPVRKVRNSLPQGSVLIPSLLKRSG